MTFHADQPIRTLVVTRGADHDDIEHTVQPGALGYIASIETLPAPQGLAYTVVILVGKRAGIVNVFDESDGPITDFIAAQN